MAKFRKIKKIESTWREGIYLDPMSIIHFLAGSIVYYLFSVILGLEILISILIVVAGAILWEIFEISVHVKERPSNRILDVILALVGFFLFYNFIPIKNQELVFGIVVSLFLFLWIVGGYYYLRHKQGM